MLPETLWDFLEEVRMVRDSLEGKHFWISEKKSIFPMGWFAFDFDMQRVLSVIWSLFFFFCVLRLNSHFFFLHSDDETVCRCLWYLIFFLIFSFFYSDVSSHFLFLSVFFNKTFTFRQHVCPIEAAIKVKPISQRQLKINPVLLFKR